MLRAPTPVVSTLCSDRDRKKPPFARVDNVTELLAPLQQNGVEILKRPMRTSTASSREFSMPTATKSTSGSPPPLPRAAAWPSSSSPSGT